MATRPNVAGAGHLVQLGEIPSARPWRCSRSRPAWEGCGRVARYTPVEILYSPGHGFGSVTSKGFNILSTNNATFNVPMWDLQNQGNLLLDTALAVNNNGPTLTLKPLPMSTVLAKTAFPVFMPQPDDPTIDQNYINRNMVTNCGAVGP